ncbi:14316_t:CDS:2 [Acaulospora colombiana]|uniref:14316_t:CDS:1 n=1 Tax=Acaulospora colombiana TaxID=27376 RepID=A0ACA9L9T8_9GLOM|nr:14316_t:CDS:2 [Acaulospora colombiana]
MSGVGYIGSKISLISRSDIRYVGILHSINSADSTVALEQGRRGNPADEIPPSDNVFEYIVFRGSDVKDLHVCETPAQQQSMAPQVPNDPAILGTTAPRPPNFQGFAPPPPLGVQPPPNFAGAALNPFYLQQMAAVPFQQQQQYWQPPVPQQQHNNLNENTAKEAEQPKSQQQKEHGTPDKVEDHKTDKQASTLKFSKMGTGSRSSAQSTNTRNDAVVDTPTTAVDVENLTKKVGELSVTPKETNGERQTASNNRSTLSSSNRLPGMGGHLVQPNRRGRGSRRSYSQNYDRSRITVPQSDFDFELSNAKFNKDELVKEVVKKIVPNHEVKEENEVYGIVPGPEEEEEDILIPPSESYYDKAKSFFDNISCETKERLEQQGPDGRDINGLTHSCCVVAFYPWLNEDRSSLRKGVSTSKLLDKFLLMVEGTAEAVVVDIEVVVVEGTVAVVVMVAIVRGTPTTTGGITIGYGFSPIDAKNGFPPFKRNAT